MKDADGRSGHVRRGQNPGAWVVIAAFNEARVIGTAVRAARTAFEHVLVVDDCSADTTGDEALRAGAVVLRHPVNLGQGAALQTGIDHALAAGARAIVTFDGDGQHSIEDASAMLALLESTGCDVVLGSRFLGRAVNMSASKRLLLRAAVAYTRWTTGLAVSDTHNGLRVLSRSAAERIHITQDRMAHASEILSAIAALKLTYREAPVTITYTDYSVQKGQRLSGAFTVLRDLMMRSLYR